MYVASWEIENNRLYIKSIKSDSDESEMLESVFPGEPDGKFADWYSGEIEASSKRYIEQLGDMELANAGLEVTIERKFKLVFQKGRLISEGCEALPVHIRD
jgi:hypothetical protein